MILLIDNYDSFVYNLARYVRELGEETLVRRHDAVTLEQIETLAPTHIILSPGPCTPVEAGISTDVVRRFGPRIPVLGVCLGHQCIAAAYGGQIVRAKRPMHCKVSRIFHDRSGIMAELPSPFHATRYHSLVIDPTALPASLRITATSDEGEIMGVEHRTHPVVGVQFHPESALTEHGYALLDAFLHGPHLAGDNRVRPALPDRADGRHAAGQGHAAQGDERLGLDQAPPPVALVR